MLTDTHCHLNCEPLYSDIFTVLESARRAGVSGFITPGVHPDGWEQIARLAEEHKGVYTAFGIHPMHADILNTVILERLEEYARTGVAIGEIGLDLHSSVPRKQQEQALREQIHLAVMLRKPILVHCRGFFQRTLEILREENANRIGGIMHAFSGSPEMAREFTRLGFLISISGAITWKNAVRPIKLAREIPLDSLVLETDSPNLALRPYKDQPNQPARLKEVLVTLANIRDMAETDLAKAIQNNIYCLLGKNLI